MTSPHNSSQNRIVPIKLYCWYLLFVSIFFSDLNITQRDSPWIHGLEDFDLQWFRFVMADVLPIARHFVMYDIWNHISYNFLLSLEDWITMWLFFMSTYPKGRNHHIVRKDWNITPSGIHNCPALMSDCFASLYHHQNHQWKIKHWILTTLLH